MDKKPVDMAEQTDLTNHFLIAMPQLNDPNFSHALTYICEHNESGALGIVVNRPLSLTLKDILEHIGAAENETLNHAAEWVYSGGPVQTERGFVLHRRNQAPSEALEQQWESTLNISDVISLTTSKDILTDIGNNKGPGEFLVALGYAGWGAGQLEKEVGQNAWLTVPADAKIIFNTPVEHRWHSAATPLGIDINLMSSSVGHA